MTIDAAPAGMLRYIEALSNRAMTMDADGLARLRVHKGKVIAVEAAGTDFVCHATITDEGVKLHWEFEGRPDVRVRGTPSGLAAYLAASRGTSRGRPADLEVFGDVTLAQQLTEILQAFEPDWEESLSRWVGDMPARKFGNLLRASVDYARHVRRTLAADLSEYLRYEWEFVPEREEVDALNVEVDRLREDADRLVSRIARLEAGRGAGVKP